MSLFSRKYLKEEGLWNLKNYKYVSGTSTPIDTAMAGYWNFCVNLLPMWMAPNLVTLLGTGIALISVL